MALSACGSSKQSSSGNNSGVSSTTGQSASTAPGAANGTVANGSTASTATGSTANAGAATTTGTLSGGTTAPVSNQSTLNTADTSTADAWCAAAAQTQIMKNPKHTAAFAQLCANGKATSFFTGTLVNSAYTGSGTPTLTPVNPTSDTGGIVSEYFGTALKLPVSSAQYFAKAAPTQGTVPVQTALIQAQGGTPGAVTSTPEASNPDKGWVRGWTIELPSTKTVVIVNVVTDYSYQADQYQLANGLYLYTSTLLAAKSTLQDFELIGAGLDINGTGYLISIVNIAAQDHGLSSVAESTVTQMAQAQVVSTYNAATGN